jgi:hypothetical protein
MSIFSGELHGHTALRIVLGYRHKARFVHRRTQTNHPSTSLFDGLDFRKRYAVMSAVTVTIGSQADQQ